MPKKSTAQLDREIAQSVGARIDRKKLGELMSSWGGGGGGRSHSTISRGKSRAELVDVARVAAAAVFAPRKVAPSAAAIKKAKEAAFQAIRRHDRLAGTADHPVAPYSHGIAELAAEATEEARQRWEMHHDRLRKVSRSSHSTIVTRDYEYVVYPETSHRHAERAVKVPMRRVGGSLRTYDLTDAKRVAKQMGTPASIYSVSKGRFVGYVHPSGRYVTFR